MQPSSFQKHKVNVLIEYKELLTQLYQLCYQRFSEHKELWTKLFNEKKSHIERIKNLEPDIESGMTSINPTSFKVEALRFIMQGIRSKIEDLKSNPLTFQQVLIYIKEIEDSMIEKNFVHIFQNDSREFKRKTAEFESEHLNNVKLIHSMLIDIQRQRR